MSAITQRTVQELSESQQSAFRGMTGPFRLTRDSVIQPGNYMKNAEWSMIEKAKYIAFLQVNYKKMDGREHKNLWALYQEMGAFIKTRNFRQCKSYHQKNLDGCKSIKEIIVFLQESRPELKNLAEIEKQLLLKVQNKMHVPSEKTLAQLKSEDPTNIAYIENHVNVVPKSKDQELKECQELFVEWINRLKNLILPEMGMALFV